MTAGAEDRITIEGLALLAKDMRERQRFAAAAVCGIHARESAARAERRLDAAIEDILRSGRDEGGGASSGG